MSPQRDQLAVEPQAKAGGTMAPFRSTTFRNIWLASLGSNLGLMIQGVGAAWTMTQLTTRSDLVALVQTAQMLPVMLFALGAGAVADMYDRRKVALTGLITAFIGAAVLAGLGALDAITPVVLLVFCFLIGSGMSLLWPSWQASVSEQVPDEDLAPAIALNSISYNIARSFGPALGGVIVAAGGALAAFGANALLYLPFIVVLFMWKRVQEPARLPPEGLPRAIVSGVRYVFHSPSIRTVLVRTQLTAFLGGALTGLLPLVAKDLLHGDAQIFGLLLGAYGVGAVAGALNVPRIERLGPPEAVIRYLLIAFGAAVVGVGLSSSLLLTCLCLLVAGGAWMASMTIFNVSIQTAAPRWVSGRALATFQASTSGGLALGAWAWGVGANHIGTAPVLLIVGALMLASPLAAIWLRMPTTQERNEDSADELADPTVRMAVTHRSGPVIIEVEYRIDPAQARQFYNIMQGVRLTRQRNGGYGWSLSRDIADIETWVETYSCPTWLDYLRQRSRISQAESELQAKAWSYHLGPEPVVVRRRLERPFGSVRWKDEARDPTRDVPRQTLPPGP